MNQKSKTEDADPSRAEFINTNFSQGVVLTGTVIRNANCTDVSIEVARHAGRRVDGILVTEPLRVYRSHGPTSAWLRREGKNCRMTSRERFAKPAA